MNQRRINKRVMLRKELYAGPEDMLARAKAKALPLTRSSIDAIEDGSGGFLMVPVGELDTYLSMLGYYLTDIAGLAFLDERLPVKAFASDRPVPARRRRV